MRRAFGIAALVGILLGLGMQPCWACSCAFRSPHQAARHAEAVFTGVAVEVGRSSAGTIRTRFMVEAVLKGPRDAEITVGTGPPGPGAGCGVAFHEGRRYTVLAYEDDAGALQTNSCWFTGPGRIDPGDLGLSAADPLPSTGVDEPGAGSFGLAAAAVAGAVLVAAGAGLALRGRFRRDRSGP